MSKKALKSKFVKITKDIINIRANGEPTTAEDDEAVHGFIENRTVFGSETSSGDQFQNHHWSRIQKYLRQSYVSNQYCDVNVIISDGTISVNWLMVILLFPDVLNVHDGDLESVIVPDYTLDQIKDKIKSLLNFSNINDTSRTTNTENTEEAGKTLGVIDIVEEFICQICDKQFNRQDKMKYHLFNEHYDDFIRCSDSVPKILAKNYAAAQESKSLKVETKASPVAEKEKTSISKPSALARIFAKKNKVKNPTPVKSEADDVKKTENNSSTELETLMEEQSSKTIDSAGNETRKENESPKSNFIEKSQKTSKRKSPRRSTENLIDKSAVDEKNEDDTMLKEKPVRKPRSSPRGSRLEEDASLVTPSKERAIIAPPSMKLSYNTREY